MFLSQEFHSLRQRSASGARSDSRGAQGPFASHRHLSTNSPRGLLAKKPATAMSRIEKEQVENAFCLRVGSKTRERIYLRH